MDVYRIFHQISAQYTFFSAASETFSKIDYILGHKARLSKYKKIKTIPCKREEIKRFLKVNENENMTYWNLWDTAKAVLRGKFRAMSAYIKRTERSQINDSMLHLNLLDKQE
jgi:hypothetical protein